MGRLPPNPALAFTGRTQNTCSTAQPPIAEPIPDCEQNVPVQCDLTEGVPAYPREPGENLFCYYQRLFLIVFTGGDSSVYLSKFNNLSELTSPSAARTNLGLGSVLSDIATLQADTLLITGDVSALRNDVNVNTADISLLRFDVNNLGTLALQDANTVSITGGSITGITDLAIADGGTGASTPAGARVNLLPSLGGQVGKVLAVNGTATDVEWITPTGGTSSVTIDSVPPVSPNLGDLWWDDTVGQLKIWYVDANSSQWVDSGSGGGGSGGGVTSVTASGVLSSSGGLNPNITLTGVVAVANGGTGATNAGDARSNLELGSVLSDISGLRVDVNTNRADIATLRFDVNALGTLSAQNANAVAITGGSISGITDLAIADGGTGASSAPAARSNLGLGAAATRADSFFLQSANNLSDLPSPSTARANLGVSSSADVLLRANNFSDIGNVSLARANLGLGSLASQDSTFVSITGGSAVLSAANIGLLALPPELGYPTAGAVDLRFDLSNNVYIGLTGNTTFTASGFSSGRILTLNLRNTTGATVTLTWPAWYPTGTAFPASLGANESLCVRAECYGTSLSTVYAQCISATQANPGLIYNVRTYGATGNGVSDDTAAINLAIANLNITGGSLYFPEGTYKISSTLSTIADTALVFGEGPSASKIYQSGSNAGVFHCFQTARDDQFAVRGLRLAYSGSASLSSSPAVLVQNEVNAGNDNAPNLTVSDVDVRSDSGTNKGFIYGFQLQNIKNSSFDTYYYTGDNSGGGTAIIYQIYGAGGPGLKCIGSVITNCFATLARTAIQVTGSLEGLIANNCQFVGLTYGFELDYCIHVAVSNSHINATWDIYATGTGGGVDQLTVTNCLLYVTLGSGFRAAVYGNYSRSTINSNSILAPDGLANTYGVYITGGLGVTVNDNSFYDLQGGYIYLAANDSVAQGNTRSYNVGLAASPWVDAGSGNSVGDSRGFTQASVLSGGSPTETISLDISRCNLGRKPDGGAVLVTSDRDVTAQYDWDDGANSATTARIRFFRYDGGNLGTGPYRISARFGP